MNIYANFVCILKYIIDPLFIFLKLTSIESLPKEKKKH